MARKPKVIETPGDSAPATETTPAKPAGKAAPQPEAATITPQVLERRSGWVLTQHGWIKE